MDLGGYIILVAIMVVMVLDDLDTVIEALFSYECGSYLAMLE